MNQTIQHSKDRSAQKYAVFQNKKLYENSSPDGGSGKQLGNSEASYAPSPLPIDVERLKKENSTIFKEMVMKP
jgi:hypothetical protein